MWLLDANVDVHLVSLLMDFGISCDTTANRGWKTLSNGDLVTAAVAAGFICLLTRDHLFGRSAAQALKAFPQFAVVVVNIPQLPWRRYRDQFAARWAEKAITPIADELIQWP
jgi:hypothetical protein